MKNTNSIEPHTRWHVLAVFTMLMVLAWPSVALAQGYTLSGKVFGGGVALPNTLVEAMSDGTTNVVATSTSTSDGSYAMTLVDGTYDLKVTPPQGSGFGTETIQNIVVAGANRSYDIILLSAGGGVSGTVRGLGGDPLPNVWVNVYNSSWQWLVSTSTDADGEYALNATGSLILRFSANNSTETSAPSYWSIDYYSVNASSAITHDVNLPAVKVSGVVRNSAGEVVAGARITMTNSSSATNSYLNSTSYATSAADGSYSLVSFATATNITVQPPAETDYSPLSLTNVSLSGSDVSLDLTMPAPSALVGKIRGAGGEPVSDATVNVYTENWSHLGGATTDANGDFSIRAAGKVILSVYGNADVDAPPYWSLTKYGLDISGTTRFDIDLPVVKLSGVVKGSDGTLLQNVTVRGRSDGAAGNSYWYSTASATTAADGSYELLLLSGSGSLIATAPTDSTFASTILQGQTFSSDSTIDLTLLSDTSISGYVRGLGSHGVANVAVNVYSQGWDYITGTQTDANGYYSVPVSGRVLLYLYPSGQSDYAPSWWYAYLYDVNAVGEMPLDFNLPVAEVTGTTTDSNGAGIPNVGVSTTVSVYEQNCSFNTNGSVTTDAAGAYKVRTFRGTNNFTIQPPAASGFRSSSLPNVSVTGDLTQRIILQRPDLAAPQIVSGPIVVHLSSTAVSITWTTNEASTSRVEYGIGGLTMSVENSALVTNHEVTLLDLPAASTFQFRVGSSDASGNGPTYSPTGTFSTQAVADTTPPVITQGPAVTAVDQTTAMIQWSTNEPATSVLAWGITDSFGNQVSSSAGAFTRSHSIRLTGLTAQTTYYVRVTSVDPDGNGVTSSTFSFTTLAVPDTTPPIITAGPTVTATTDRKITVAWTTNEPATSGVSFNDGAAYDVVSDSTLTTEHEITLSGLNPATTYYIKVSSTDAAGNGPTLSGTISASTDATPDTTAPAISNVSVSDITKSSAVISWTTDEASNSVVDYGTTAGSLSSTTGNTSPVTTHQITLSGLSDGTVYFFIVSSTDGSGNTAAGSEVSFKTESAFVDQPPSAPTAAAPTVTNASSFAISWTESVDDVAIASYEVVRDGEVVATLPSSVTTYDESGLAEGSYTYVIRATDSAGHEVASESVTVVVDRTAPVVSADDVTVEATGAATEVAYEAAASDNVDGTVSVVCTPASGTLFAVGETTITCATYDSAGNQGSGSFKVVVKDTTAPVLNVPVTVRREATGPAGASVQFETAASDLVDGAVDVTCSPASGSTFALGTTSVSCSATDEAGNSVSKSFDVVVEDTTAPTVSTPADLVLEATSGAGAAATFSASGSDLVSGTLAASCSPASGTTFALGTTVVTCTATDAAGNSASADFRVTVRDTTAPVLTVPADLVLEATSSAGAVGAYSVTVSDVVSANLVASCTPSSGSLFGFGTTTVSCSATDAAGNRGTATFNVTVRDTRAPAIASATPSLLVLWPPDHKLVPMVMDVKATDAVDPAPVCRIFSIVSNEAIDGLGDGDTSPDWVIGSGLSFQLRAERAGKGPGRIYSVTVACTDATGNTSTRAATVTVPASQGKK